MNILVTGYTGFIGHHLVRRLCGLGHNVKCLVRNPEAISRDDCSRAAIVQGDLNSPRTLVGLVEDVEAVYHLAGATKAITAKEYYLGNYLGTKNLIEVCSTHSHGISQFLYLSSLAAVGPSAEREPLREDAPYHPVSDYGRSKMMGEREVVKASNILPVTIIRPSAVYGPGDTGFLDLMRLATHGVIPEIGFQSKLLNLIYCQDLIEGIMLAANNPRSIGETYFLGSETSCTVRQIGDAMAHAIGIKTKRVPIPHSLVYSLGAINGAMGALTHKAMIFNFQKALEVVQPAWTCSVEKAKNQLGFCPKTTLDVGMLNTYEWYRKVGWL